MLIQIHYFHFSLRSYSSYMKNLQVSSLSAIQCVLRISHARISFFSILSYSKSLWFHSHSSKSLDFPFQLLKTPHLALIQYFPHIELENEWSSEPSAGIDSPSLNAYSVQVSAFCALSAQRYSTSKIFLFHHTSYKGRIFFCSKLTWKKRSRPRRTLRWNL